MGDDARQYDPTLGKWTSDDPIGMSGGDYNFGRYVANGPTTGNDPSGLHFPDKKGPLPTPSPGEVALPVETDFWLLLIQVHLENKGYGRKGGALSGNGVIQREAVAGMPTVGPLWVPGVAKDYSKWSRDKQEYFETLFGHLATIHQRDLASPGAVNEAVTFLSSALQAEIEALRQLLRQTAEQKTQTCEGQGYQPTASITAATPETQQMIGGIWMWFDGKDWKYYKDGDPKQPRYANEGQLRMIQLEINRYRMGKALDRGDWAAALLIGGNNFNLIVAPMVASPSTLKTGLFEPKNTSGVRARITDDGRDTPRPRPSSSGTPTPPVATATGASCPPAAPGKVAPGQLPAGKPGTVIRNQLSDREVEVAQTWVDHRGGTFTGQTQADGPFRFKKGIAPGIDGYIDGVPAQIKRTDSKSPTAVSSYAKEAGVKASNAGVSGVEVFIHAPNVSAADVLSGPVKNILQQQPSLSAINVLTKDGMVRFVK